MATSVVNPRAQFFANNGRPLIGGRIHTYVAGSSTRARTYKDAAKAQPNTNPIILDGRGEAQIYLAEGVEYKFVVEDSKGALIYTQEPVYGAIWPNAELWPSNATLAYRYMTEAKAAAGAIGPIKFYDTYAQALADAAGAKKLIEVAQDETRGGARTRYWAEAGTLTFVVNLDQLRLDLEDPNTGVGRKFLGTADVGSARGGYVVAAVVRRDTSLSPNWETIEDGTHKPMNWIGPNGGSSDLELRFKAGPVGSLICGPDETLAKDGVTVGISGGGGTAFMSMGAPCTFEVDLDTQTISKFNSRYFASTRFSVAIGPTGGITLTHPASFSNYRPIIQYSASNSLAEHLIPHYVLNAGMAGSTTLQLIGEGEGNIIYNGSTWNILTSAWTSADCTFSYNGTTGDLTVTHPQCIGSPGIKINSLVSGTGEFLVASVHPGFSATGFTARLRKLDGSAPTLGNGVGISFTRGLSAPRKVPAGKLMVDLGRVQVAVSQVNAPTGNVWILGVNNNS